MTTKKGVRPVQWDTQSPYTLLLPVSTTGTEQTASSDPQQVLRLDRFLASDGVGCNNYEISALIKLVEANESYFANDGRGQFPALQSLSASYRRALRDCLEAWEKSLENDTEDATDATNVELLKIVYAVMHLSEIYLLVSPTQDFAVVETQGAVTADTVRYLRYHHMNDAFLDIGDSLSMEEILESSQPEQFDGYWNCVRKLVLRGCLDEAWSILSRHSMCRRAFAENIEILDDYHAVTLDHDRDGFIALQAVMLSAPLPGGLTDYYDACLDSPVEDEMDDADDNVQLLENIPRDAWKLWESGRSRSTDGEFSISYNPHAAKSAHREWSDTVKDLEPLYRLATRIPQLDEILSIFNGEYANFDTWSDALCAELLYVRPAMRPDDMHVRAARLMEKHKTTDTTAFDNVVLSVMKGNAGLVIKTLHDFGGGSGAALPATMTALMAVMLTEAKLMPSEALSEDGYGSTIQTELLLLASEAILSSLDRLQADTGVRLSTRLLLPFVKPSGDLRITATLSETLGRYWPQNDAEASSLISICRHLLERKSARVLIGCRSLAMARYKHYMGEKRPGGAVHWLIRGIELEKLVYIDSKQDSGPGSWQRLLASGVCGQQLTVYCVTTSQKLLKRLVQNDAQGNPGLEYNMAKDMVEAIREDEMGAYMRMISQVKLLFHLVDMFRSVLEQQGDEALAQNVVACLEEMPDETNNGVVAPLAHPSMYEDFITLALKILERDEERYERGTTGKDFISSFDVNGIHILMARFAYLKLLRDDYMKEKAEEILSKGLTRAFILENSQRKPVSSGTPDKFAVASQILTTELDKYSLEEQELAVQLMLEPMM